MYLSLVNRLFYPFTLEFAGNSSGSSLIQQDSFQMMGRDTARWRPEDPDIKLFLGSSKASDT